MHAHLALIHLIALVLGMVMPAWSHVGSAVGTQQQARAVTELNLMKLLSETRAISLAQQQECSSYYFPQMDAISQGYEQNSYNCKVLAEQNYATANAMAQEGLNTINLANQQICAELSVICPSRYPAAGEKLGLFDCYKDKASSDVSIAYVIAMNATLAMNALRNEYERIDAIELECQTRCYESYQQLWNEMSQKWHRCVLGIDTVKATPMSSVPATATTPSYTTPKTTTGFYTTPSFPTTTTRLPTTAAPILINWVPAQHFFGI